MLLVLLLQLFQRILGFECCVHAHVANDSLRSPPVLPTRVPHTRPLHSYVRLARRQREQVFYEPTALARCREGSIILLRLCAALEAFDITIDPDQAALDSTPRWPILEEEDEWDRRAEAASVSASAAATTTAAAAAGSSYSPRAPSHNSFGQAGAAAGAGGASRAASASASAPATAPPPQQQDEFGSLSWFQQQRQRQKQEAAAAAGRSSSGGWAASALSEIDQV